MRFPWNLSVILAFPALTLQQGNVADTVWIVPGPGATDQDYSGDLVALLGGTLQLEWYTDLTTYNVYIWQQHLDGSGATLNQNPIFTKASTAAEPGGYTWQVEITSTQDLNSSPVFFFGLGTGNTLNVQQTCHYFNITTNVADVPPSRSSTTTATSSTALSSSTTSSTSASTFTSSPASTSTTPAASAAVTQAAKTNPTSQGTTIGLGVGLGVGIPIVLLLAAILFLKIRSYRRRETPLPVTEIKYNPAPPEYPQNTSQTPAYGSQYNAVPQFSSESHQRHELPDTAAAPHSR